MYRLVRRRDCTRGPKRGAMERCGKALRGKHVSIKEEKDESMAQYSSISISFKLYVRVECKNGRECAHAVIGGLADRCTEQVPSRCSSLTSRPVFHLLFHLLPSPPPSSLCLTVYSSLRQPVLNSTAASMPELTYEIDFLLDERVLCT